MISHSPTLTPLPPPSGEFSPLALLYAAIGEHVDLENVKVTVRPLGEGSSSWGESTRHLAVRVSPAFVFLCYFGDQQSPCPECFDRRLWSVLTMPEQQSLRLGYGPESQGTPYLLNALTSTVGLLARKMVDEGAAGYRNELRRVFAVHMITQEITATELMADSFCTSCSPLPPAGPEQARMHLRPSLQARSGKGRMNSLTDYQLPVKALINPFCGVAGLAAIPGYAQSVTAPVFGQYTQRAFEAGPRIVSWSGLCTRTKDSRIAGMLESLERQAGMLSPPSRIAAVGSYSNLAAEAMDPALCVAFNEECYELPLGLTPYTPDLELEWIWGFSITSQRPVLVPRQLVYYDRVPPQKAKIVDNTSSGCALGSCYEEAILKALFELLERDSFVLAWSRHLALPRIDPASCSDRKARMILERVRYLGYDIHLLDGRLDLKIPAVIAIGRRRDREIGSLVVGASASTDCDEAVRGALLEAATSIVEVPAMIRNNEKHVRQLARNFHLVKTVSDHAHLYGLPEMADRIAWLHENPSVRPMTEMFPAEGRWRSNGDIGEDLLYCLGELAARGITEVVAVDLTTREQRQLDVKTVRVIAPGLAPIDFGYPRNRAAGLPRLQTAPAAAGLKPVIENAGLNPLPHPFP